MPRIDGLARGRMLDGSMLQPHLLHAERLAGSQQRFSVGRNEVCPRPAVKREAVKPKAAVQRVQYSVPPAAELPPAVIHSGSYPRWSPCRQERRRARTGNTAMGSLGD